MNIEYVVGYKKETLLSERQTGDAIPSDVMWQSYN